jgi:cyclopropane fatty-acyl-phospholipid synthase-like methyltransferase
MGSTLRGKLVEQFRLPRGLLGRLAGQVMARRPSNLERSRRTLDLLGIEPEDRVLEIGFGPGVALAWAAERASRGRVVGVDHSVLMLRQAARRNAAAIASGRVELRLAAAEALPAFDAPFDKAYAVNVSMFWGDPVATLSRVAAALAPGGRLALTFQPRRRGATDEDARRAGERLAESLAAAGFVGVSSDVLAMKPVAAVCVLGSRPAARAPEPEQRGI